MAIFEMGIIHIEFVAIFFSFHLIYFLKFIQALNPSEYVEYMKRCV